MTPEVGQIVGGRYRLERPLAKGGMGAVWVARHVELDVPIALKFILEEVAEAVEEQRVRFKREAQAAAQLKTPHVAQIHDFGLEGSMPYIAMELLEGEDLATRMEREGKLGLERALPIIEQLCRGLQIAHDAGIVHRDLKPANIFLARMGDEEMVKILDFGIAKLVGVRLPPGSRTNTGALMGTPRYMSPEQALGVAVGPSTDLWAIAVVLFEMLTGAYPFAREVLFDVAGAVGGGPSPLATEREPSLPQSFDAFFERALAFDPKQRFRSPRELASTLAAIAAGEPMPELAAAPVTRPAEAALRAARRAAGADSSDRGGSARRSNGLAHAATAPSGADLTTIPVVGAGSAASQRPYGTLRRVGVGLLVALTLALGAAGWLVARRGGEGTAGATPGTDAAVEPIGLRSASPSVETAGAPMATDVPVDSMPSAASASPTAVAIPSAAPASGSRPSGAARGGASPGGAPTAAATAPPPARTATNVDHTFGI